MLFRSLGSALVIGSLVLRVGKPLIFTTSETCRAIPRLDRGGTLLWAKFLIVLDKFINLVKNLNNAVCKDTKDDAEKLKAYFNTVVKFKAEKFGGIWKEFYSLRDKAR